MNKTTNTIKKLARRATMTLLLLLVTTTAWATYTSHENSQKPIGYLEVAEGESGCFHVVGWTCDPFQFVLQDNSGPGLDPSRYLHYITKYVLYNDGSWWESWWDGSNVNYWAKENQVEIHLQQNGKDKEVYTFELNVERANDILQDFLWRKNNSQSELWCYPGIPYFGFDYWIKVFEPGDYTVVAYGTNVHGNQSKEQLTNGTKNIHISPPATIAYNLNGGSGPVPPTELKTHLDVIKVSNTQPTREGYTFIGWNSEPDSEGTPYRLNQYYTNDADVTFYAQWVRKRFFDWDTFHFVNKDQATSIRSVEDWNDLATLVNNGYIHSKTITLENDIGDENNPVTRCIGTQEYPFDNNFDGNGHTIYVDINDTSHEGTAPFRYVGICSSLWQEEVYDNGRWIKHAKNDWEWQIRMLKVRGTVRGGKYCSGLVGISKGVGVLVCAVQADVITNSTDCGGVIGYVNDRRVGTRWGETNIVCTVFSGSISGATERTGMFIGSKDEGYSRCYSCLSTGTFSGADIDFSHPSDVIKCYKTTDLGKQATYTPYDPAAIIPKMVYVGDGVMTYNWSQDDDGSILPFHQVYIDNAADWDKIAMRIANGASFKGRQLIMRNDITAGTMLGTAEHPFDGSFDGQNHTLTFNLTTDESGCAPFRYIKDAEIKNLNIGGTLAHSVDAKTRLAGVAAYTSGKNNRMENITVSSTIRSQAASFHHAGLVAQINDGRVIFQNCTFKGKLLCDANSLACGGLVAVNMGSGTKFQDCIFAPTECTVGTEQSSTICRDIKKPSAIVGTCYTQELGKVQGSRVYTDATVPDNVFCSLRTGPDNANYYQPVATYIGGLQHTYNYNDGKPIDIDYTFYCYQYQQDAEKYTATIRKTADGTKVTDVTDIGSYILSITANEGSGYHGTTERAFYVTESSLPMNNQGHFLINSADDWNTLCELSSDAHKEEYQYFEGRVVELTADINVTQQLSTFCGTLAGNGHTLTFNLGTDQNPFTRDGAALIFNLRGNAVVENLHIDGTIITSEGRYTAGLVGSVGSEDSDQHNVRINNCRSSIRIKTTYNGECYNGGFVGFAYNGKLAINNCLFDGCFTSQDQKATHWAGFVGLRVYAAVSINSCLYFANRYEMSVPSGNNATFYLPADASNVTLQNCCHTEQNWVNKQGTYVENNHEASVIMTALGKEGWFIDYQYPQWQDYYEEAQEWPLVLPRIGYHTAVPGNIAELEGSGTAADPYLIGSTDDWSVFADSINNNVGTDAYYRLTEDITINHSEKVGTVVKFFNINDEIDEHRAFRGTFDGNGHTLTLDMTAVGECAPFAYAHDCTIKDLNIDGTINTSGQHASSLIVNASGEVNITGCRSSVTINSSYNGAGYNGGFVARSSGTTNIEGCLFEGSILGETTYSCGGFVGSRSSGTVHITGSFFAPAAVTIDTDNGSDNSATFCTGGATINNSYYTQPIHTGQGTALHSVTAAEGIDMSITGDGALTEYSSGISVMGEIGFLVDDVFYAPAGVEVPIEKLELIAGYSPQDATIAPSAGTYANGVLTMPAQNVVFQTNTPVALSTYTIRYDANGGTGTAMADMNLTYGDDPVELTANSFTRSGYTFAGWNTETDGSGTAFTDGETVENLTTASGSTITLYAQWEPWIAEGFGKTDSYTPDGTADNPYIINSEEEWNLLCGYISSKKGELASSHYRLGNNLTVSRTMGTERNPFRGTFEGADCTLTLDLTGLDKVEADPEKPEYQDNPEDSDNPEDPDIYEDYEDPQILDIPDIPHNPEDIPVEDTLHAVAPFAYVSDATIKNLRTTGTIYGETSYYAAGIVGKAEGNTTLQSCHSNVAITSTASVAEGDEESPMLGGIVAQSTGTLSLTDCLFDGSINAENTSYCGGFLGQRKSGTATFTNCLMEGELNCNTDGCGTFYQPDESDSGYTITNSYYRTAYGASQGTQTDDTGEDLRIRLGENWLATDEEKVVPVVNTYDLANGKLSLSPVVYPYTGSPVNVSWTVRNFYNELLSENTDYTVTIQNAAGETLTGATDLGEYALTINGTGDYTGTKSVHFCVYESDGGDFPLQTDNDFQHDTDNAGYFYVRMPRSLKRWPYDEDPTESSHEPEDNPRVVNIPAGFTRCFKVYDDGGKQRMGVDEDGDEEEFGYYEFGEEVEPKTLTLTCPEGFCFSVQGTMILPDCHSFTIYDGSSVGGGGVLLDHANGHRTISPIVTSGNSITFYLDPSENRGNDVDGFDLTARVIPQVPPTWLANDDSQLEGSEKNASVIAANDGGQVNVALNGRTLYRDGTWNTLCLPFDIANIGSSPLRGATVKTLKSTNYSDGELTLNFSQKLTSLEAGKPYIAKWDPAETQIHYTATDGTRNATDDHSSDYPSLFDRGEKTWMIEYNDETNSRSYYPYHSAFCEFVTSEKMFVTGYTMSNDDSDPDCSPTKWTLRGKMSLNDSEWTLLDSRDVTETGNPEDTVPTRYDEQKNYYLAADKQGTYQYFRIDVEFNYSFYLCNMQLIGTPVIEDIVNPTFMGVTIKDELHPVESVGVTFEGSYSSLDDTDGLLLDAHNAGGNAFHATLSLPDVTLFTDAEHTTPATGAAIPFAANGNVTFYFSQSDYALTLHDDDSEAADGEKNANLIAAKDGEFAVVTLDGRTLYKDGHWNTLCLPFDIDDIEQSTLRGATVKALEKTAYKDGAMTLGFSSEGLSSIEAGKSYIVKWETIEFPVTRPSEDILNNLGFIDEIPTLDYDDYEPHRAKDVLLIDGDTDSQYERDGEETSIKFHYEGPITPTGYAIWTADNVEEDECNPASWTIWARNEGDEDWTELATVDNENGDKLPMTNSTCTLFELNNSTAYQYFKFTANGTKYYYDYEEYPEWYDLGKVKLSELQLFTARPNTDIVNPVFEGVTIKGQTDASNNFFFEGSYSSLASTDGQMLDAHNAGGNAFHAAIDLSMLNVDGYDFSCYSDAGHTTPADGTIPFDDNDGNVTIYPKWMLTLNNADTQAEEKNIEIISYAAVHPVVTDVTLAGRTLYKDGDWNTLCLPFALGNPEAEDGHYFDGTLLEGATVKTLESTDFKDGLLTMNFVDVHEIIAGTPYLVKWEGDGNNNLVNPVFTDVTISNDTANVETEYVNFVGTYSSVVFDAGTAHKDVLFLGKGSTLYYPDGSKTTTVNAFRAYFTLNGITAGDPASGGNVKGFVLNFDGEDDPDAIHNAQFIMHNEETEWYDLSGRKIPDSQLRKGIYITRGKKVLH